MKGDISRETFERRKHYTGVRMQQGRVLVDSEWNEQVDIDHSLDQTAYTDIIGPSGAPREGGGFLIVNVPGDLIITPGRMWVEGILVESDIGEPMAIDSIAGDTITLTAFPVDASRLQPGLWLELILGNQRAYGRILSTTKANRTVRLTAPVSLGGVTHARPVYSYTSQPHLPAPPHTAPDGNQMPALSLQGDAVVWLDVWERHLTAVEDESMREVALGGPDTTTRTQAIWQVRIDTDAGECKDIQPHVFQSKMLAQTAPVAQPPNPCIVPSQAGFRGLANQLYRVEIHKGSGDPGGPTFKWSRDNGAFVFAVEGPVPGEPAQLRLRSLGRDDRFGLAANDWVELIDDRIELEGRPGVLARVDITPQESNRILILEDTTLPPGTNFNIPASSPIDLTRNPRVRLWSFDRDNPPANGDFSITAGDTEDLEDGIQVVFSGTAFRSGEYWLIPARTAINEETGDIEWPRFEDASIPLPPRGIDHHHAALAEVDLGAASPVEAGDCRPLFSPITAPELFYLGGDGQEVMVDAVSNARVALAFPLRVGVSNGGPIKNAAVRFQIMDGDGILASGSPGHTVFTDQNGVASTTWQVSAATTHQRCEAVLIAAPGFPLIFLPSIHFTASVIVQKSGACTITLSPVPGWENALKNLGGKDAEICFQIGDFELEEPLVIAQAGALKFTGGGSGTRILARKNETAIRFEHCAEVTMRDLSAESDVAGSGTTQNHLNGVLTFNGCGLVLLESMHVKCGSAEERTSTCVTVNSVLPPPPLPPPGRPTGPGDITTAPRRAGRLPLDLTSALRARVLRRGRVTEFLIPDIRADLVARTNAATIVHVRDCEFEIGNQQVGLLLVDPLSARIEDNTVTAINDDTPLAQVLANPRNRVPFRRLLINYPWVEVGRGSKPVDRNFAATFHTQERQFVVRFRTDPTVVEDWTKFAGQNLPAGTDSVGAVIRHLRSFANSILLDPAVRAQFPGFRDLFERLRALVPFQASQGIVVGGTRIGDVQILGNVISGALQAVHIGANQISREGKQQGSAARVEVSRNTIGLSSGDEVQARHGIHVTTARHTSLAHNLIQCDRERSNPRVEGIRVIGTCGPFLGVQSNHVRNCDIVLRPQNRGDRDRGVQWFATDNLTESGINDIFDIVRTQPPNVVI